MAVQVALAMVGGESCKPLDETGQGRHAQGKLLLTQYLGCANCLFYQGRAFAHIVATVFDTEGFTDYRKYYSGLQSKCNIA